MPENEISIAAIESEDFDKNEQLIEVRACPTFPGGAIVWVETTRWGEKLGEVGRVVTHFHLNSNQARTLAALLIRGAEVAERGR